MKICKFVLLTKLNQFLRREAFAQNFEAGFGSACCEMNFVLDQLARCTIKVRFYRHQPSRVPQFSSFLSFHFTGLVL